MSYGKLALYATNGAGLRIEPVSEIHRLTGDRVFLFVDHVALVRNELRELLSEANRRKIPISVVGAERDNEWNIYCEQLESFVSAEFPVNYLSEKEIRKLLEFLEQHNALGVLKDVAKEERVRNFVETAERQLLVALHELTLGVPFEDIVVDEFRRIEPAAARHMYLDICALHQFGAPVRAGLVSRCSGIVFDEFKLRLMRPLEKVVHVVRDPHSKDVHYRSRHPHVAEIVFNGILPSVEDKFDVMARIVGSMNVDYASDWETFTRLVRGREIARIFPTVDLGRLFYNRIQEVIHDDGFVAHQRAVFEMSHADGSLDNAQEAAERAFELDPDSRSIRHTQSEIMRRVANRTADPLRKRALRRGVREKLSDNSGRMSQYDSYTRARVAIDELRETLLAGDMDGGDGTPRIVVESAKEAETEIQRGLQAFPDSQELLTVEADFRDLLDQDHRAREMLEAAFAVNPRQDWLAARLGRRYREGGDVARCRMVLEQCLQVNPSSKLAHLEVGRLLSANGDQEGAVAHLRRSFTEGDGNYEGQFWYNRELFIQGEFDEAYSRFEILHARAPGRFRTKADCAIGGDDRAEEYEGRVVRIEYGYAFLQLTQSPRDIFASRGDSSAAKWDGLGNGDDIACCVCFSRRGPRATSVTPRYSR